MRIPKRLIAVAAMTLLAGGCASMSEDECIASDWHAVGFEDGARGYSPEQFGNRRKACAKHGVTADFAAYQDGRKEGLVEYCQPSRGFNVGANGGGYSGVCDAALEPGFLESYRIGRELYDLRSAVGRLRSARQQRESALDSIDDTVRDKELALISKETPTEDRILLLADLKQLSEDKGSIEAEIEQLIADITAAEIELSDYERTISEYGY
jgi:hypothetical protein